MEKPQSSATSPRPLPHATLCYPTRAPSLKEQIAVFQKRAEPGDRVLLGQDGSKCTKGKEGGVI